MPEPLFDVLARQSATLRWAPAELVRRRGDERRRRRRLAAGAAAALCVLTLVLGITGYAVHHRAAPRPADPTAHPPLTDVPPAAMIRPEDLPGGVATRSGLKGGDWSIFFDLSVCPYNRVSGPSTVEDSRTVGVQVAGDTVIQTTELRPAAEADRYLVDARANIAACASSPGSGGRHTMRIVLDADDVLVTVVAFVPDQPGAAGPAPTLHILARRGVLVTELTSALPWPSDVAINLIAAAARHLCEAQRC